MKIEQVVEQLSKEFGVESKKVMISLSKARALKGINIRNADYNLEKGDIDKYMMHIAGRVPIKLYIISATERKTHRNGIIFSSRRTINNQMVTSVTTLDGRLSRIDREERVSYSPIKGNYDESQATEIWLAGEDQE